VSYIEITETTMSQAPSSRVWIDMNENESYTERHECSFVQAGNKFYYFGGRESPRRVEAYDYASNTWSVKTAVPVGEDINHFQAAEHQGLVWVIGAFKSNKFPSETPSGSVLVFDPANDVWMRGSPVPQGRRRGAGGLVNYKGKFYLLGGNTNGHRGGSVSWFDEYHPQTGKWKSLPVDAPRGRDHFHAAVVRDRMYAVGGRQSTVQ
jgi:N-acetylneuraminic acid mutarotase